MKGPILHLLVVRLQKENTDSSHASTRVGEEKIPLRSISRKDRLMS